MARPRVCVPSCGIIETVVVDEVRQADPAARILTAPIAAAGLLAGFAVAKISGSRPLGGIVLAVCGLACIALWWRRDGLPIALLLTVAGLLAFALSHLLGLAIGAWPAVLLVAAATAGLCWRLSDSRRPGAGLSGPPKAGSPRTQLRAGRPGPSA